MAAGERLVSDSGGQQEFVDVGDGEADPVAGDGVDEQAVRVADVGWFIDSLEAGERVPIDGVRAVLAGLG